MAVTDTTALANQVKTVYDGDFYLAGQDMLYYDPLCDLRIQMAGDRGRTYEFPLVERTQPNTATLSEVEDVTPQGMRDAAISVTLNEYGGAIEITKFLGATAYADIYKQAAYVNGYNMAESFDRVVRATAGQGGRQFFQNARTARSSFTGQATAADRMTPAFLELLAMFSRSIKMPLFEDNTVAGLMHPFQWYDLLQATDIRTMATRQNPEMLFNGETAYWSGIRIIVSPSAKAFWGAGAVSASSLVSTLAASADVSATNLKLASVTNLDVGNFLAINDAEETGNTWSDTNELFYVTAVGTAGAGGTGVDGFALDPGPGDGGGLRYAHASGATAKDNNSVYPLILLGPKSLTKAASDFTGPYGETIVTPPIDRLQRFMSMGWYAIVGYSRTRSGWLLRGETGASQS